MQRRIIVISALSLIGYATLRAQGPAGPEFVRAPTAAEGAPAQSERLGDLEITPLRVEGAMDRSVESPDIKVFVEIRNTGTRAVCAFLVVQLETTSGKEYESDAGVGLPDANHLSPGETTEGSLAFRIPLDEKPLQLVPLLFERPVDCRGPARALKPNASTPGSIVIDLHHLPGSNAPDSQSPKGVDTSSGYVNPSCIRCPGPKYTEAARKAGFQGTVTLQVVIRVDGSAGQIEITQSSGYPDLDRQTFETIQTWKFKPASAPDGSPFSYSVPIQVSFRLLASPK